MERTIRTLKNLTLTLKEDEDLIISEQADTYTIDKMNYQMHKETLETLQRTIRQLDEVYRSRIRDIERQFELDVLAKEREIVNLKVKLRKQSPQGDYIKPRGGGRYRPRVYNHNFRGRNFGNNRNRRW